MSQEALQEALLKANAKLKAAQSKIKKQDAIIQQLHRTIECSRGGWHGDGHYASKEDKDEESLCCICLVLSTRPTPHQHLADTSVLVSHALRLSCAPTTKTAQSVERASKEFNASIGQ